MQEILDEMDDVLRGLQVPQYILHLDGDPEILLVIFEHVIDVLERPVKVVGIHVLYELLGLGHFLGNILRAELDDFD